MRRLVAAQCGVAVLQVAQRSGHAGASVGESLEATPSLGEFYRQMQAGVLSPATAEGQWRFGLALLKTSLAL